jgi:hypothetical protein
VILITPLLVAIWVNYTLQELHIHNYMHENVTCNEPIKKRTIDKNSMMIKLSPQRNYRYHLPSPPTQFILVSQQCNIFYHYSLTGHIKQFFTFTPISGSFHDRIIPITPKGNFAICWRHDTRAVHAHNMEASKEQVNKRNPPHDFCSLTGKVARFVLTNNAL